MLSRQRHHYSGESSPVRSAAALWLACTCMPAISLAMGTVAVQDPPPQGNSPASPQEPAAAAAPAAATKAPKSWLSGQLKSRYLLRWTGDDSDNDLVETLVLDAGHSDTDKVTGHLMGRLAWDMDGYDSTFSSINDSYGGRLDGLLYDAYADVHRVGGFSLIRLGRQSVYETPEFAYFDGAHVASEEMGDLALQAGGYIGSSVHLYESSKVGDLTAGVYLQARPWKSGRMRIDYMHLEDEDRLQTSEDDLFGAGYWQGIGRYVNLEAHYSRIADRDRDVLGRATARVSEWGTLVQASYYALLRTQGDLVLEADPFFNALNELNPYDQWTLLVAQDVTKQLRLQAAGDLRRLHDSADEGFYNRDYDHLYGTATLTDLGTAGLRISGTADWWNSDDQDTQSWGADASYDLDKTTASIGTYYSLYKYDLFSNTERDHVRTYFLRLRHKASDAVTFEGDYELENDDYDQYQRLRLGVTWRF